MSDSQARLREKVGQVIEKAIDAMLANQMELNAAFIGRAMEFLDGKGQKGNPNSDALDPVEAAMMEIRAGRNAGESQLPDDTREE